MKLLIIICTLNIAFAESIKPSFIVKTKPSLWNIDENEISNLSNEKIFLKLFDK
jgi:hypothetical protein